MYPLKFKQNADIKLSTVFQYAYEYTICNIKKSIILNPYLTKFNLKKRLSFNKKINYFIMEFKSTKKILKMFSFQY
jgi:hypothetical protein